MKRPRSVAVARLGRCVVLVWACGVAACHAPLRPVPPGSPNSAGPQSVEQLAAAVAADSQRSERESDPTVREQLATSALRDAGACLARAPENAACVYYQGLALGLDARAHPLRAGESLKAMIDALDRADGLDANYDQAGPSRVKALVLVRAPGWPLGPGDAEGGVTAARRAVSLQPRYPPNVLTLAEALTRVGDARGARDAYARARELSESLPPSPQREEWLRNAARGLQHP